MRAEPINKTEGSLLSPINIVLSLLGLWAGFGTPEEIPVGENYTLFGGEMGRSLQGTTTDDGTLKPFILEEELGRIEKYSDDLSKNFPIYRLPDGSLVIQKYQYGRSTKKTALSGPDWHTA